MKLVLLDTTAWIDFLRPGNGVLGNAVRGLIAADRAVICGVVVAELLRYADRNDRWHIYFDDVGDTLEDLLAEVDEDPTCIFWG